MSSEIDITDGTLSNVIDITSKQLDRGMRKHRRMAFRFARMYSGRFAYTDGMKWLEFNGSYWEPCSEAKPWNAIQEVCREALRELPDLSGEERDNLYKDVRACDEERGIRGVLAFARYWRGINQADSDFDAMPHLFATQNGTLDLNTGEFRDSDPFDFLTLAAGCDFDPTAECPMYDALMELFQPDPDIRAYLHRLAGAAMEGRQNLQNLITWYGRTGANGKGTTTRAWQNVFGSYARVMPVEALIARKGADQYRDEKAQLKGARLVITTEPSEGARFDTGTVKALTGGDRVKARAVYRSAIEFDPTWLIIMSTNTRVATPDDGGMARRLKEVAWNFTVTPENQRDDIDEILRQEASGILNRILAGWREFLGFNKSARHPESVEQATAEYLTEVNPISTFIDECIIETPGILTPSSMIYQRYTEWCAAEGIFAKSNRVFSETLVRREYEKKRVGAGIAWKNIELVPKAVPY